MKRVCVFVDGENLRHSICDLFESFDKQDHLPKNALWKDFYDWLVCQIEPTGKRVRTYWYVIDSIDYSPYKFPKSDVDPVRLKKILSWNAYYNSVLEPLTGVDLITTMDGIVKELQAKRSTMRNRFEGWHTLHNGISVKHEAIEFRRAGAIKYDLFTDEFGKEKAVDVKLAVDLITLQDIYDTAIIVSGDQDYVPAVQIAKDKGKRVVNASFLTRGGKLLPGGAWRLNQHTDTNFEVPYDTFKSFLRIGARKMKPQKEKPLTLHPLSLDEALTKILTAPPPSKKPTVKTSKQK